MADIASTSWSETAGSNTATPPDGWPENMNFSDVNNTARETHAAVKRFWDRINPTVTLGGSATAYTYTPSNTSYPVSYNSGELFCAIATTSNSSTSPTVNVNGLGARTYKKYVSGAKTALAVGDIPAGQPHYFYPDSTTTDVVLFAPSPIGTAGGDLTGSYPNPTVGTNKIGNTQLAQMAANTIKGNNTAGSANAADLTATQVAAMLSISQMSDYAENSWTPTLIGSSTAGTQTYVRQVGRYIKTGDIVHVWGRVTISAKDASIAGNITIGGLPITSGSVDINFVQPIGVSGVSSVTLDAGYSQFGMHVANNATTAQLTQIGSNKSTAAILVANLGAAADIIFAGSYYVGT